MTTFTNEGSTSTQCNTRSLRDAVNTCDYSQVKSILLQGGFDLTFENNILLRIAITRDGREAQKIAYLLLQEPEIIAKLKQSRNDKNLIFALTIAAMQDNIDLLRKIKLIVWPDLNYNEYPNAISKLPALQQAFTKIDNQRLVSWACKAGTRNTQDVINQIASYLDMDYRTS